MTTPSELPATEEAAPLEGRLHPWSWLFALIAQLQSFALPLIALLVFGSRGNGDERWQFIGMLAGLVIVVVSVVQYFTYRYGVVGDDLVIREGILHRNRRNIPMQRIRNVSLQQNLLHRLFVLLDEFEELLLAHVDVVRGAIQRDTAVHELGLEPDFERARGFFLE